MGSTTTTFSLPVTVYDPELEHPVNQLPWGRSGTRVPSIQQQPPRWRWGRAEPYPVDPGFEPAAARDHVHPDLPGEGGVWGGSNRQFALRLTDPGDSGEAAL